MKSFPSCEDVDDEVCRLSRPVFSPLYSVDNQKKNSKTSIFENETNDVDVVCKGRSGRISITTSRGKNIKVEK